MSPTSVGVEISKSYFNLRSYFFVLYTLVKGHQANNWTSTVTICKAQSILGNEAVPVYDSGSAVRTTYQFGAL